MVFPGGMHTHTHTHTRTHTHTADLQIQQFQKCIDYISGGSGHTGVSDDYEATCSFTDEL